MMPKLNRDQELGTQFPMQVKHVKDWRALLSESKFQTVLVFKHSNQCEISHIVLQDFQAFMSAQETCPYGIIDVLEARELSNLIASEMDIRHESPQVIMIDNSVAVWHASHWSITSSELQQALEP